MMTFYFAPGTCSLASHIVLEEVGAAYRAVRIDTGKGEQYGSAYREINPKSRVPALSTDRGILTETPAILAFLAQAYPDAGLAPLDDPFAFAEIQAFNSYLCSTVHVAHAHGRRGSRWADDPAAVAAMKAKMPGNMAACFELIEATMVAGPWVMGARYSIADAYLYTIAGWLAGDGVDPARFDRIADHTRAMEKRPAVQAALAAVGSS
ncbi:glutathione S-transferase family protein [Ensifer soli]|uniref:glutathione S-transferase family protein n=1 Tax=Ciceribacter sp. sgz301302 TaxID=3342379 RepID=UPI0035B80E87